MPGGYSYDSSLLIPVSIPRPSSARWAGQRQSGTCLFLRHGGTTIMQVRWRQMGLPIYTATSIISIFIAIHVVAGKVFLLPDCWLLVISAYKIALIILCKIKVVQILFFLHRHKILGHKECICGSFISGCCKAQHCPTRGQQNDSQIIVHHHTPLQSKLL